MRAKKLPRASKESQTSKSLQRVSWENLVKTFKEYLQQIFIFNILQSIKYINKVLN